MAALPGLALVLLLFSAVSFPSTSIVANAADESSSNANDGSVLQALLESHYSEWMELVERAQMLHPLEQLVETGEKLTIFAPHNHQMQPEVKSFLLKPPNAHLLKKTVQYHILTQRLTVGDWRDTTMMSLAGESVTLRSEFDNTEKFNFNNVKYYVGEAEIVAPDVLVRADGIVHGVDQMLLPTSAHLAYVSYSTRHLAIPLPTGAPGLDTRRIALEGVHATIASKITTSRLAVSAPAPLVAAPSPTFAPAPAPGPGPSGAPFFDGVGSFGDLEVTTFVMALARFGGYSEFAGLLVDITGIGAEIARAVNRGRRLTILAPDDNAWKEANLTVEQLNSPNELEELLRYHIISEYQTEESLYSTLRRNGKTTFGTLHNTASMNAHEVDGLVIFGETDSEAGVFDHDIHADGSVSVQGVDKVIFPLKETETTAPTETTVRPRSVLEMLQLPSRKATTPNGGPRRTVATAAPLAAVTSLVVLLLINFMM